MTLNEQTAGLTERENRFRQDAIESIAYVSATVDGTERHAVRRVTWKTGSTSGTRTECGRNARPSSFDTEKVVTCKKCERYL
jgi:hypothetical protein